MPLLALSTSLLLLPCHLHPIPPCTHAPSSVCIFLMHCICTGACARFLCAGVACCVFGPRRPSVSVVRYLRAATRGTSGSRRRCSSGSRVPSGHTMWQDCSDWQPTAYPPAPTPLPSPPFASPYLPGCSALGAGSSFPPQACRLQLLVSVVSGYCVRVRLCFVFSGVVVCVFVSACALVIISIISHRCATAISRVSE